MSDARASIGRHRGCLLLVAALVVAFSSYIEQVVGLPAEPISQWPSFPRRNIAALARDGYLRNTASKAYKRGISTLAKNGLLPTYRSPYVEAEKQDQNQDETQEKRNVASIARLRSYAAMKRNIQALARDGYRVGRGQYNPSNDKRNIAALARNGLIHKKEDANEDEYYFPFYQNPIAPVSEIDHPFDINEMYDYQQSINPDMFPSMSQVYKRSQYEPYYDYYNQKDLNDNYFKRSFAGSPVHGLYRPNYFEPTSRTKRYVLSLPDNVDEDEMIDQNDIEAGEKRSVDHDVIRDNFEKRHIGSLARLGLLPSFRYSGGRYSRSGRARLILPSQELYRKHSPDENFGIREYLSSPEAEPAGNTDDADIPPPPVPAHSHPTGRLLHRPLNNDLPTSNPLPSPPLTSTNYAEMFAKNRWQSYSKETPKFYYFRSLKVPYHTSGKRYLLLPAVDNILLRKGYRNSSLPSRRKNQ
ncbi:neuropeptide-like precursor 1 isoform X2 [Trichoplusia ni]|uniref:Neuropeptide-like precursor 1 isoform X2 n=1 Tax=Trichoplusia ni TaxID=7111 RepID=A0A7E5VB91_TRINI|nr:neuropeptide-like precursor 1 isoform X2 [Trichoplusia ni]